MSITLETVREALSSVIDPNTGKDFIPAKAGIQCLWMLTEISSLSK